jgi:putative aldouronate transport system substrate-binding protein
MKRNRIATGMALLLALLIVLAGCQGNQQEAGQSSGAPATSSQAQASSGSAETDAVESDIPNFNATGYPICPDETVTLRVMMKSNPQMPSDLNTLFLIQRAEEIMNVHIDWTQVPDTGWEEKKNLMLATGDLPDIIESQINASDLTKYGPEGTFIPMQDLIEKYAVNFQHLYEEMPDIPKFITAPDGNVYGMARVNSGPWMTTNGVGAINKGWLDKLGLDMPETLDDFYDVLKAFKTGDPNGNGQADEIPMAFAKNADSPFTENNGVGYIFASFGLPISNEAYTDVIDGKVVCQGTLPEFKEAVTYLVKLYQEGLMDQEGFTTTHADLIAKLNQSPSVLGYAQVWDINDIVSNPDNNAELEYMPILRHADGREPVAYKNPLPGVVRGWGTITRACETPEVAMRWLDYFFEETNSIEHIEGPIGVRLLENPDGTLYVREPPQGMTVADDRFSNCNAQILAMPPSVYRNRLKLPHTDKKVQFVEANVHPLADKEPMMPVYYSEEESVEIGQLQTDIRQYIDRKVSEWMMNGNIDAEWDSYLAELDKMGVNQWTEIKQTAYDRYISA